MQHKRPPPHSCRRGIGLFRFRVLPLGRHHALAVGIQQGAEIRHALDDALTVVGVSDQHTVGHHLKDDVIGGQDVAVLTDGGLLALEG